MTLLLLARRCEKNWLSSRALARVTDVRRQLQAHLKRCGVPLKSAGRDPVPVLRALTAGFFSHAAVLAPFGCAGACGWGVAGGDALAGCGAACAKLCEPGHLAAAAAVLCAVCRLSLSSLAD